MLPTIRFGEKKLDETSEPVAKWAGFMVRADPFADVLEAGEPLSSGREKMASLLLRPLLCSRFETFYLKRAGLA